MFYWKRDECVQTNCDTRSDLDMALGFRVSGFGIVLLEEMNERMKVSKPTVIHDLIWTWRFLRKNCGPQKFEREEHGKVTRECGKDTGEGTGQSWPLSLFM